MALESGLGKPSRSSVHHSQAWPAAPPLYAPSTFSSLLNWNLHMDRASGSPNFYLLVHQPRPGMWARMKLMLCLLHHTSLLEQLHLMCDSVTLGVRGCHGGHETNPRCEPRQQRLLAPSPGTCTPHCHSPNQSRFKDVALRE